MILRWLAKREARTGSVVTAAIRGRGRSLPRVMDDVLVTFDPERAKAVAERLCEFSRDHQILLFTCHPSTAELMREIDPSCGRMEMARFGGGSILEQVSVPI